ncbi:hypothetical protein CAPTEDRAFT_189267 [Capitella teleta]|uniref:AB hydrolase-1 domain-containing protein n=1 Tax=Capitella teleta TaxID=283909 RepID=R7URU8_CAPTE|nr:hypothetical protein CAPTEDRAFT_189267 [Capitella teleta]|eukprot:ELU06632.1 hypothetical protein CAPTEDRAFT_189267 [Capitella teleta]
MLLRTITTNSRQFFKSQRHLQLITCRNLNSDTPEDDNKNFFPSLCHEAGVPETREIEFMSHGTVFKVGFVDVGPRDGQLLICLHGVPGDLLHFSPLFSPLTKAGIRMLVPEFPGYGRSTLKDRNAFDESTVARAMLVLDFMQALGIEKGVRPYWGVKLYEKLLNNPLTSSMAERFLLLAYQKMGGIKINDHAGLKEGLFTIANFNYPLINECAKEFQMKGVPTLFTATENDVVCEWPLNLELSQACGLRDENTIYYDKDEKALQEVNGVGYPRGVYFERGGHWVYRSHTDIVASNIIGLMNHLQKTAPS